jgi:RecA-family ATPase
MVVYDTLADLFAGNENNRAQARQFVGMLRGLAIETRSTALLLTHPSLSGLSSGSGTSGSTAWSNSVRSRLYLERVKQGASEPDPDVRVLRTMKANYGRIGGEIRLRWHEGVFLLEGEDVAGLAAAAARQTNAEQLFLRLLTDYLAMGRHVGPNTGPNFAPSVFSEDERGRPIGRRALLDAMNRLLKRGAIRVSEHGPQSRRRSHLEIVQ